MFRRSYLFVIAVLMGVCGFCGNARADEPKAEEGNKPRLVAQLGHSGKIHSVAFSPDGKQVLTGSDDETARLWDTASGMELRVFAGHAYHAPMRQSTFKWPHLGDASVSSVAFSPDGKRVLTGSADKTAKLWDAVSGKELRTFKGHSDEVSSVAFSPDCKLVLTGSLDKTARLWDLQSGKEFHTFRGHTSWIRSVAFAPDGKQLLTGSGDHTVRLWDVRSGKELHTFEANSDAIAVAFSPDCKLVISGSWKTALLWDVQSGKKLRAFTGHTSWVESVMFSPDGNQLLTGSWDNTARMWDVQSGKELRAMTGHADSVLSVAFSPDGKQVLTGSEDGTARLWDAKTGQPRDKQDLTAKQIKQVEECNDLALKIDSNMQDGKFGEAIKPATRAFNLMEAIYGRKDWRTFDFEARLKLLNKAISLSDKQKGELAKAMVAEHQAKLSQDYKPTEAIKRAQIALDVYRELLGEETVEVARVWHLIGHIRLGIEDSKGAMEANEKALKIRRKILPESHPDIGRSLNNLGLAQLRLGDKRGAVKSYEDAIRILKTELRDGDPLLAISLNNLGNALLDLGDIDAAKKCYAAALGNQLLTFAGNPQWVPSVVFSPDGRQILTGTGNALLLWDAQSGRELRKFRGLGLWADDFVAIAPDGNKVLAGSSDNSARLWETQSGKELRTFKLSPEGDKIVLSCRVRVAFSADGQQVLTSGYDNIVRLWDIQSGKEILTFVSHKATVLSVAISRNGEFVLTGCGDNTARLWDARTGKLTKTFEGHSQIVNSAVFSPDGKQVLTGSADKTARLWDVQIGNQIHTFIGHGDEIASVAFSPDAKQVLTGSLDKTARLWDAQNGREIHTLIGHTQRVTCVAFSPDGKQVVTGSWDRTIRFWDVQTGCELCKRIGFEDGTWAVTDPDGRFDASNGGDVEGLHWVVGLEPIALKQLKERYYDPGLLAKYMGFNKEPLRKVEAFHDVKLYPEVAVAEVKPGDKQVTLKLSNRGGGIGRVQVFINGKELLADARGPKPDVDAKQATLTVDLDAAHLIPGKPNKVEIVTWNAEGYLSSRGLVREWTPEGQSDPNPPELYVIVCGISDYAEAKLNLRYAAKDAEDMARAIKLAGNRLFGADKVHLTLLTTGDNPKAQKPTKENIRKAFESVCKAKPNDLLVVYLAGHGVALKQGSDEYCYLTVDARGTDTTTLADPAVLASWAVTSSELVEWIKKIPALKQVMLLDTCAAGAAVAKLLEHRDLSGDQVRALDRLKDRTGFHVLMGCASDRVSYEASQFSQGLLTYSLLQGMAGAKLREGEYVDVSGLFQYAADEVPNLARGIGGIQKPLVMAPRGTSFDIGRLVEADRKALPLAKPKPLILRPLLSNAEDGDDNLRLASLVGKRLADDSFISPRNAAVTMVYVDADELAGAVRPAGTYTIDGKKVTVRLVLKQDGQTLNKVTVDGSKDDLPALSVKLAEAIREGVKK